jgi:Uncharacterized protein involved in propionate catabolism
VIGVAAAVAHLLKLDANQISSAVGTAGTQAAGLWQFLMDATHSKQVHTAKACLTVYSLPILLVWPSRPSRYIGKDHAQWELLLSQANKPRGN